MIVYYLALFFMTGMGALGALFLKKASDKKSLLNMIKTYSLYLGGGLYFVSSLINIWVLKYLDYSLVLPLTSFTYIWTMCLSAFILKEKVTKGKIIGLVFILIGSILISL